MPNLRGASPVGRGGGGRRARQRCRTPGRVGEGARRNDRRGRGVDESWRVGRVAANAGRRGAASEVGSGRPGPSRGGRGRSGPAWGYLGRSGPDRAGLNRSGSFRTGSGGSDPGWDRLAIRGWAGPVRVRATWTGWALVGEPESGPAWLEVRSGGRGWAGGDPVRSAGSDQLAEGSGRTGRFPLS